MSTHKPTDRHWGVGAGAVMTDGRSLNLAKGVFGVFQEGSENKDGAKAVSSFKGLPKTTKFKLRLGTAARGIGRTQTNKAWSSFPFALNDIQDIRVSAPTRTEQVVDDIVIGFDGNDASKSLKFAKGKNYKFNVELQGGHLSQLGYPNAQVNAQVYIDIADCFPDGVFDCEDCDPCEGVDCLEPTLKAIEILKNHKIRGGLPLSDFVDITPVRSCDTNATATRVAYDFYTLEVCDTGDDNALALVQAQYPSVKLEKIGTNGVNSTYQMLIPATAGAPSDYEVTIPSLFKNCADCPAGYTEIEGGFVYAITLEDDGVDLTANVQALPNAVANTAIKGDGQINGQGVYLVVLSQELTQAEINTYVTANPTATVENRGEVASACENTTVTTESWVEGTSCELTSQEYQITLQDNECGESRLAELQKAYPDLSVVVKDSQVVTVTGTSGEATLTIGGMNAYALVFDTDIATTIANFQATEATNILGDTGYTLTSDATSVTLVGANDGTVEVTIVNASGDLAGTIVNTPVGSGGCRSTYFATTLSNLVCPECDPVFEDTFTTEAPSQFDFTDWKLSETSTPVEDSGNCLCGIRFRGKVYEIQSDEDLRYEIGFVDDAVKVQVSGGYLTEVGFGIGDIEDKAFDVTKLATWKPRTHMGGNYRMYEDRAFQFFGGEDVNHNSLLERKLKGMESSFVDGTQYVEYQIEIRRDIYAQSFGQRHEDNLIYHVCAPVGRHADVEALVNNIASAAGLPMVKAFAK